MRVLMSRSKHGQRGAVALLTAFSAVVLCVMAAFVVDFGQAYANKNQAQTAADAAALAAGKVYGGRTGTCDTLAADTTIEHQALAQADAIREQDLRHSTHVPGDLATCEGDVLEIHYEVSYDSPLGLGQLVTGSNHVTVDRQATVALGAAQSTVGSLRPWMVCGAEVPPGPPFDNKVVQVYLPDGGHQPPVAGSCTPDKSGGWWKTSCYNAGGSHGDTVGNVLNGCDQVTLAPLSTPPPTTPATLGDQLLRDCNKSSTLDKNGPWVESTYCLADDNGNDSNKSMVDAWTTLLGKTVALPVFCDIPQCNPTSVPDGTKSLWPVWKIVSATICGFDLKGKSSSSTLPTGDCNNYNTDHLAPSVFDNSSNNNKGMGFLVIFRGIIENGGSQTFPVQTSTTVQLVK
jgi:Putative Flp pilus-assembly TadE/G-like